MSRTALVTGATGFLGRAVVKAFETSGSWSVTGLGFSRASPPKTLKCDITDADQVEKILDEVKPSVIVHCAADRSPDSCNASPTAARTLNVSATSTLASLCSTRSILLIYISTDYVFPGRPGEAPYTTSSTPEPTNLYGELKLAGETVARETAAAQNRANSVVVLRVPVLYGDVEPVDNNRESAITVLVDAVHKAQTEPVAMDDWALRYPTNTLDVGRVCKDVAEKYLSATPAEKQHLPQILHFSSEDRYTKYQICELIADVLGLPLGHMQANKQGGGSGTVQRPYDTHLSNEALTDLGIDTSTMEFRGWWRWKLGAVRR